MFSISIQSANVAAYTITKGYFFKQLNTQHSQLQKIWHYLNIPIFKLFQF